MIAYQYPNMRLQSLFSLLLLSVFSNFVNSQDIKNGLVLHFPFDGSPTEKITNAIVTNKGATLDKDRHGVVNCAYRFDGKSNIIVKAAANEIPEDEITVAFWARANQYTVHSPLIVDVDDINNRFNIHVHYYHNGGHSAFWDYGSISSNRVFKEGYALDTTIWEFYTFTASKISNSMKIFKNGILQQNLNNMGGWKKRNGDLMIGGFVNQASVNLFYYGLLDDIRIYNRVLSQSEIDQLYKLPSDCSAIINDSVEVCQGGSFYPNPPNGQNYKWQTDPDISNLFVRNPKITPSGVKSYILNFELLNGSPVVYKISTKINPTAVSNKAIQLCPGEIYYTSKSSISSPGYYEDTLKTHKGCDSIIAYTATWRSGSSTNRQNYLCKGDVLYLGGQVITSSGIYYDSLKTTKGCDSIIVYTVTERSDIEINKQLSFCIGDTFFINSEIITSNFSYVDSISVQNGCDSIITTQIFFLNCDTISCWRYKPFIPNAFTPNGDGLNDQFGVFSDCPFVNFEFIVFNRWGEIIFRTNNANKKWNGWYMGKLCQDGVYAWLMKYNYINTPLNVYSGTVHLLTTPFHD